MKSLNKVNPVPCPHIHSRFFGRGVLAWYGVKNIHFVGIGGIGVSGLAKVFLLQKKHISGSDLVVSKNTRDLEKLGAKIFIGPHKKINLPKNAELLVHTSAATSDNPELVEAKKRKIPCLRYAQVLGLLTREKRAICVSGTHGKTTTTSLISLLLAKAGLDPTCIIGSNLREFDGNARYGKSDFLVLEADEYKAAFLNYWPQILVLTTVEYEHPDYFKNLIHTIEIYKKYVTHVPKNGVIIANADDKNILEIVKTAKCRVVTYGIRNQRAGLMATNIRLGGGYPTFKIPNSKFQILSLREISRRETNKFQTSKSKFQSLKIGIPGIHNVYNALAAVAVTQELGIKQEIIQKVLANYHGAWRRFEYKKVDKKRNITIIDDYAHHPTEIRATLKSARERFPKEKIICIYQPHQIKRTKIFFKEFLTAFDNIDELILTDIYAVAGREKDYGEVSSQKLAAELQKRKISVKYIKTFKEIVDYISKTAQRNCVIITMGAGTITEVGDMLAKTLI